MLHPQVASRTCADCQAFLHDDKGPGNFGLVLKLRGTDKPMPRPPGTPTPCKSCPKIPVDAVPVPENAIDLSPEHFETLRFYRECRAVGQFPNDPRVRWAAALIKMVEDAAERAAGSRAQAAALARILGGLTK